MATSYHTPNFRRIDQLESNGSNYFNWRHQVMGELLMHNLHNYVQGIVQAPSDGDPNTLTRRREKHYENKRHVSSFLMSSVHVNYNKIVLSHINEPRNIMEQISESCISTTNRNIGYYERQIHSLRLKDFNSLEKFVEELDKLFMTVEQAGREFNDTSKVSILLSALPSSFETIKTIIENRNNITYVYSCSTTLYARQRNY